MAVVTGGPTTNSYPSDTGSPAMSDLHVNAAKVAMFNQIALLAAELATAVRVFAAKLNEEDGSGE